MSLARPQLRQAALLYVLFAVIATAANILTQEAVVRLAPQSAALALSIAAGTIAGFAVKYILDKVYVFADAYVAPAAEARKIMLYGAFSVLTTLIFWGFELAAWWFWQTTSAKYAGAVLGLAIGYALKFALDSRFVFKAGAA
jgi:putative flippase GtrA